MNTRSHPNPLSSPLKNGRDFAAFVTPGFAGNEARRSEAFAEDLLGDMWFDTENQGTHLHLRWHGALQCAVPLTVALVGGVIACLNTLA